VLRYGDEIGMGDDLSLEGRYAVRTPMQWSDADNAGFSTAPAKQLVHPVIADYRELNVTTQRRDPDALLGWFERMIHTLRECPEVGAGRCEVVDAAAPRHVLIHRFRAPQGSVLFLHNLADEDAVVDVGPVDGVGRAVAEVFSDGPYDPPDAELRKLALAGHGYRWLRLDRDTGTG
jgi:maltose alpha-D-glucosyltransferase/alpha-amylase